MADHHDKDDGYIPDGEAPAVDYSGEEEEEEEHAIVEAETPVAGGGVAGKASSNQVNANVEGWFAKYRLPWSGAIWNKLDDFGIECVEDLKLTPPEFIDDLFQGEKPIVRTKAKLAWAELGGEDEFEFSESYPDIVTETKEVITETSTKKKGQQATRNKKEGLPPLDDVINAWRKKGHQDNHSRLCICKALTDGHSAAEISRAIRLEVYSTMMAPWNGIGTGDKKFQSVSQIIHRIKMAMRNGRMEDVMNDSIMCQSSMRSKSIRPRARGRKGKVTKGKEEEGG